jgi:2-methylisocitrate lyase-like PEP mutase family enzyme
VSAERRARFRGLHEREQLFVMPNPWDAGSAKLLESSGFEALATTSAGFAWSLGKLDSERCYPDDPGGVAETVRLLAAAGAAGCSIEDYDPVTGEIDDVGLAAERVAEAAEAAHSLPEPLVLTGRAENHLHGVDDLDDTIARLQAYRDAGADVVYAPGLTELGQIEAVVEASGIPVNVLALPSAPPVESLAAAGVRRVSTGSLLASAAYAALVAGAQELLGPGTSRYAVPGVSRELLASAFK